MTVNDNLLSAIKSRKSTGRFGQGIRTADSYLRTATECVGNDLCKRLPMEDLSFEKAIEKAAQTLVYRNEDMEVVKSGDTQLLVKSGSQANAVGLQLKQDDVDGLELPKNTLIVFRHTLTTTRRDRDGDVLRTDGALVDPKMLLLWQHIPTLPIGKMIGVAEHSKSRLDVVCAIVDMNELCHDAAVMVDNDMARFSHGFRALEFEQLKNDDGQVIGGYDIKEFEVMEDSLVSIPSNVDAETQDVILSLVDGGKLTSAWMKGVSDHLKEQRPLQLSGKDVPDESEEHTAEKCACGAKQPAPVKEGDGAGEKPVEEEKQERGADDGSETKDTEVAAKRKAAGERVDALAAQAVAAFSKTAEVEKEQTAQQHAAQFLAKASPSERARLLSALQAIEESEKAASKGKQYAALLSR